MLNTELYGLKYPFLYSIDASTKFARILSYNIEIGLNTPIARKAILWKQRIEENLVSLVNNSGNFRVSARNRYTMGDDLGIVCYHIEIDQSLNRIVIIDSFLFALPWRKEDGYPIVDPNTPPKGVRLGRGNTIVPNYFFHNLYVIRCGTKGLKLCDAKMVSLYRGYFLRINNPSCGWAMCSFIQNGRTWYNYLNENGDLFQEECFVSATDFDPRSQTAIVIWGGGKYEIRPNGIIKQITENKQYNTMNKTKNTIRLTESQLHRIIKEAINELDPQTYASYADKIRKAGPKHGTGKERMQKAHDAELRAIKDWNDKYGYDHFNDNGLNKEEMLTIPSDRQDFRIKNRNSSYDSNGNHRYHNYDYFPKTMTQNYLRMYSPTDMYKDVTQTLQTDLPWEPYGELDDKYLAAIQMAHPDPENDYVKGKGWKRIADLD